MASANLPKYTFFWRSESPFSQWYKCKFTVDRMLYNCAEQYMMHQKAVLFGDKEIADQIMKSTSQNHQKSLGRKVSNFNEQIWNDKCKQIVYTGNFAKFSQNKDLKQRLLDTEGTILAEASPVDSIWGIGYAEDHPNARDRAKWRGQNRLGFILTDVREAILRGALSCDDDAYANTERALVVNSNEQSDRKMSEDKLASSTQKHDASSSDPQKYTFFWRAESPFSQWYSCQFTVNGLPYKCAEQYMMHQKAVLFEDPVIADQILKTESPRKQKSLGRKVSNYNQQVWDENCQKIVFKGNLAKFSQNEDLKQILLQTQGTVLAEASPMDCIWGIGYEADHPNAKKKNTWRGENRLGYILTDVREAILKGTQIQDDSGKDVQVDHVKMVKEQKGSLEDEMTLPNSTKLSTECSNHDRKAVEKQKTDQEITFSAGAHSEVLHTGTQSSWAKAVTGSAPEGNGTKAERSIKEATKDVIAIPKAADCGSRQLALDSRSEGHGKPVAGAAQVDLSNDKDDKGTGGGHSHDRHVKHVTEETSWQVVTGKKKKKKTNKKK